MQINGAAKLELMRRCLTEMSAQLKQLRMDADAHEAITFPVMKSGLMFSLDMNLASIHMLGLKLHEAQQQSAPVALAPSEKIMVGMCASFMSEAIAGIMDEILEGVDVPEEKVNAVMNTSEQTALH